MGHSASWQVHLEAANLSPKGSSSFLSGVHDLRSFLDATGMPTEVGELTREHLEACLVHLRERRALPTAASRYQVSVSCSNFPIRFDGHDWKGARMNPPFGSLLRHE